MINLEQVDKVLTKLKSLLFDFSILGGYARDLHYGLTPKDIDVCIYNYHPLDHAESQFRQMLLEYLDKEDLLKEVHSEGSANSDSRVHLVLSLTCGMDLIFWEAKDKWDVLNNFDFNINQFEYNWETKKTEFLGSNQGELVQIRQDFRTEEQLTKRLTRCKEIAEAIHWSV